MCQDRLVHYMSRKAEPLGECMIARIWRGVIPASKREKYLDLMRGAVLPKCLATQGNRGGWYLYCTEGDATHFEELTFWDDCAAITRFAGGDYGMRKYCDFDSGNLNAQDARVQHYEVRSSAPDALGSSRGAGRGAGNEVARVWRGVVPAEKAEAYLAYLADFGFRDYQSYPGYCA